MRSTFKKLCLVTTAVFMMLLPITTGTAYAAETAYNVKTQWLTARPTSGMPLGLVSRQIELRAGTYGWFTYVAPPAVGTCQNYTGPIIGGTYTWSDQLWPGAPSVGYYRHDAYLSLNGGGAAYKISCTFQLRSDGDYTWGSALDPHF
ncbi:hypothetical protein ITP53_35885 [Nonomuraea sp. K274]|uniref:Secreted protein n=1 Tax=Nonomuraea cypriaca TaxID=1187855 RepID=A0A931AI98_9ACTN|nr:hypothetical protein [Nonomuraea cypriaca]MBF8190998.1 hypothetical protein [Nonomuraea cypriaca]